MEVLFHGVLGIKQMLINISVITLCFIDRRHHYGNWLTSWKMNIVTMSGWIVIVWSLVWLAGRSFHYLIGR